MARSYDTALAKPQRTLIRSAIVAALAPLLRTQANPKGFLAAVVPFAGKIHGASDDVGIGDLYDVLGTRAPAVAVALGNKSLSPAGDQYRWKGPIDVHVYVLVNSLRSREARQAGDIVSAASEAADPGADVILEMVEEMLLGRNLMIGPSVHEMRGRGETHLDTTNEMELWEQSYSVEVNRTIDPKRAQILKLLEVHTEHFIPGLQTGGGVTGIGAFVAAGAGGALALGAALPLSLSTDGLLDAGGVITPGAAHPIVTTDTETN